jgi:RNA polymerase sigma factor (TIGR02999 family)
MRGQPADHTLQPTALVHEAYLRLVHNHQASAADRPHFLALAARAMRSILVDYARRRKAKKRGDRRTRVSLDIIVPAFESRALDLLMLDEALDRLAAQDERQSRIVELRFFGGLDVAETSQVLGVPKRTVERDWRYARAQLYRSLGQNGAKSGE